MALGRLGSSLYTALKNVFSAPIADEKLVKALIRDIQRALLNSDVNVSLVLETTKKIEKRILDEKSPPGISRREHIIKVVYEEMTRFLGETPKTLKVEPGKRKTLLLIGIQGSGKTTAAAKLARYFQKRGVKTALICTDTYRPGAYAQLKQLAERANVPIFGEPKEKNPEKIALDGLNHFDKHDLVIIDTAGRHKEEASLMKEMKELERAINPDETILVIDGTIGQQAMLQAKAFSKATSIGSILVSKLDGSARGGGALSAVTAIGVPINFISVGEKIDDIEPFVPSRFVGRLLGMGDLQSLIEKVREAELKVPERKMSAFLSGRFTLTDMYDQFESMKSIGPLRHILKMIPGVSYSVPEETMELAEDTLKKWRVIIQSMTPEERSKPKILSSSRIRRIARGSGTKEKEVKELLNRYNMLRKTMKTLRRKRIPLFGRGLPSV